MIWWIAGIALLWVVGAVATYGHAMNCSSGEREHLAEADAFGHMPSYIIRATLLYLLAWPVIEWSLTRVDPGE